MKKILLVLIALMGIGFGAKAQSCDVGDNTYVAVNAWVDDGIIVCSAKCYGDGKPTSGSVYATVYYIDKNGNEGSEMISISWTNVNGDTLQDGPYPTWKGSHTDVARVTRWEVSAGACRIERK